MISNHIAVGVDGSPAARAALLWAADECRLRRATLLIVHVPDARDVLLVTGRQHPHHRAEYSLDEVGERVLREHAAAASDRQPSVPVTTRLDHASAADALIDVSETAELVVVGSHGFGGSPTTTALGTVSDRVAAHAHCPVAIVPTTRPHPSPPHPTRIVVGVAPTHAGRLALDYALDEARHRGATLVAVSAMRDQQSEPDPSTVLDDRALRSGTTLLNELETIATPYPDVIIEPTLADTDPATALLDAAADAQLLIIGCHHSDDRWSTRLGPVPSVIAHHAPCPVILTGQHHPTPTPPTGLLATNFG